MKTCGLLLLQGKKIGVSSLKTVNGTGKAILIHFNDSFDPKYRYYPFDSRDSACQTILVGFRMKIPAIQGELRWMVNTRMGKGGKKNMSENMEKKEVEQMDPGGKRDFLKALGAGVGLAGLGSLMGGPAMAQSEKRSKYIIVITHGGNDPNRAILGLLLAQTAAEKGWGKVHVWLTLEGADLANKKKTDQIDSAVYKKFGNATSIIRKIKDKGGWFGVCPPCAEYFGPSGGERYEFVELAGGDWLMKNIQDAWVVYI